MTTCKVNGVPVKGAVCGLIFCSSNECGAPEGHKCIHMDRDQMREYTLTTRRPDGTKGRIILQARSSTEAEALTGGAHVVTSKSEPWEQAQ
jgi:NAD(P)H-dependent flavin oxidoreductase YrpB (nitropropane dioxygenase family)